MHSKVSVVVSCIDYRFWPETLKLLEEKFGAFDLVELAGGSKNIASPKDSMDRHAMLESIKVSIDLHQAKTIILTNHLDCGAYGGSSQFRSHDEELAFHAKELAHAKEIVREKFPHHDIITVFINKDKHGTVELIYEA